LRGIIPVTNYANTGTSTAMTNMGRGSNMPGIRKRLEIIAKTIQQEIVKVKMNRRKSRTH
jgi:hypothetical protein